MLNFLDSCFGSSLNIWRFFFFFFYRFDFLWNDTQMLGYVIWGPIELQKWHGMEKTSISEQSKTGFRSSAEWRSKDNLHQLRSNWHQGMTTIEKKYQSKFWAQLSAELPISIWLLGKKLDCHAGCARQSYHSGINW